MFYLAMDLETTGVNPAKDEPVQIAGVVKSDNGRTMTTLNELIITKVPISEGAMAVHKITQEKILAEGLEPWAVCKKYQDLVWEYQPITIIGYNLINFDLPMWQLFMLNHNRNRFKLPPVHTIIDVMHCCSVFFKTTKWLKLSVAAEKLGIEFNALGLHDALVDVELTWSIYEVLKQRSML